MKNRSGDSQQGPQGLEQALQLLRALEDPVGQYETR